MDFTLIIVAILGIIAGGIVNALADDLPHERGFSVPKYPDGTPRPLIAWLGITAFLFGKRTSATGSKLSWRYPLTEIATAFLMIVTMTRQAPITADGSNQAVTDLQLIFWLIYMPLFVLITVIDIEHKLILFVVIIPFAILALIDALVTPVDHRPDLKESLIGGAIGFGVFFLFYNGGYLFTALIGRMRGQKVDEIAFGYGDVMMATVSGFVLGIQIVFALITTILLGAIGALIYMVASRILTKQGYQLFTAIPYGPYIVLGTIAVLLYGAQVRNFFFPNF